MADGILDRLVHNAHRIELRGESMRKTRANSTIVSDDNVGTPAYDCIRKMKLEWALDGVNLKQSSPASIHEFSNKFARCFFHKAMRRFGGSGKVKIAVKKTIDLGFGGKSF